MGSEVAILAAGCFWGVEEILRGKIALEVRDWVDGSGTWRNPVVTEVVPTGPFYSAERYHQDYLQKNPGGYSCHILRD